MRDFIQNLHNPVLIRIYSENGKIRYQNILYSQWWIFARKLHHRHCTKNGVSINDFFSKCDQICSFLRIWSHFLKKSLMENFIICTVRYLTGSSIRLWDYTFTLYLFWRIILNSEFHILAKPMVTGIQNRI